MDLPPGQIIHQRYRIQRLLGRGGFGAVYQAWDTALDGPVALKENLESFPGAEKQFELEARLLFKLRHPNLPRVIDFFSLPDSQGGGSFAVMDYIEGEDLGALLTNNKAPLPQDKLLDWIGQVCDALTYLHSQNPPIIHRDIKPANIRITPSGRAILVDFGIAKIFSPGMKTTFAARAVSHGYSPPEQYGGGSTDARSDIYSLAATTYHLLSGRMPPSAMDVLSGLETPPLPLIDLNPVIRTTVSAALEKAMQLDQPDRFASVAEFKSALLAADRATTSPIVISRPPSRAATTVRRAAAPPVIKQGLASRWQAASQDAYWVLRDHTSSVEDLAFSPDGTILVTVSVDKTLRLWRAVDGKLITTLEDHTRSVSGVAFSPSGEMFASTSSDQTVRLWRMSDRKLMFALETPAGLAKSPSFSPDGNILACVTANRAIQFWRVSELLAGGKPDALPDLTIDPQGVTCIAFSPSGEFLACASRRDKAVRLYRFLDASLVRIMEGHTADINCLAFSPDGRLLASGSWDNSLRLWRISDGFCQQVIKGHRAGVLGVTFSPDGEILAAASADQSVRLWRVSDAARLNKLKGHTNWVNCVSFSPDGRLLVSGSRDATIRIWAI
jgi:serine/threonine protein kinase